MHPYQPRWRNNDRRPAAPQTNAPTPVTWIAAAGFAFIILYAFVAPIVAHLTGAAQ